MNFINPGGIPLIADESRYSTEESDKKRDEFKNNPTDTNSLKGQNMIKNPNLTKEGYVKPQNIKIDFAKLLFDKNALFIDGRPADEYKAGHIKGAINIPYKEFLEKTEEQKREIMKPYNKDGIIVSYCGGGECEISIDLAYEIAKLGYNSINIFLGGYKEWEPAGYPIEK